MLPAIRVVVERRSHSIAVMFSVRWQWITAVSAAGAALLFAWFTQHAWEDYFITLRSSRNLVEGKGLVFNPGECVHTFTSPLGVLLPALCMWIAGPEQPHLTLWFFRFINAGLLAGAALLVWKRVDVLRLGGMARLTFFGLLFADAKLVDFATNGMETAILVFFTLFLWSELEAPTGPRVLHFAAGCGGLMWTRPDAFVLGGALVLPHLLIRDRIDGARRPIPWRTLLLGGTLGVLLYLPWFLWAWWYYGSPVPHTIIAKSGIVPPVPLPDMLLFPWRTLTGDTMLMDLFLPSYWFYGGWPNLLTRFGHILSVIAAFAWIVPVFPSAARRLSLAVFCGMFYLCSIILFPWYSPPWTAIAALAIALLVDSGFKTALAKGRNIVVSALRIAVLIAVMIQLGVLLSAAWEMRIQQQLVERGVRQNIGEWLRATAAPSDTVFLEPLGYIGFYSRLKTYDFPGLSSPEVVKVVRGGARRFVQVIERLRPTWLVLRPFEIADPTRPENAILNDYELVKTWNAKPQIDAVDYLPGRPWLNHDAEFRVFRLRTAVPAGRVPKS